MHTILLYMQKKVVWIGLLFVLIGIVLAAPHTAYPGFSAAEGRIVVADDLLVVTDDVIFANAFVSLGGGDWQLTPLQGNSYRDSSRWLQESAVANLDRFAFPQGEESYVVFYSCTQTIDSWHCHDSKWQLYIVEEKAPNPEPEPEPEPDPKPELPHHCTDDIQNFDERAVDCGGECLVCQEEEQTSINLEVAGLDIANKESHFRLLVNDRERAEYTVGPATQNFGLQLALPHFAITKVGIEFDNAAVWDGSGQARNLFLKKISIDQTTVNLQACITEQSIWHDGSQIVFGWDGEIQCNTGITPCTPDCTRRMCGPSLNNCGSCGTCSVGNCLAGYCVTGPSSLRAQGNKLVNEEGEIIVLKGANYPDQGTGIDGHWDRGDRVEQDFAQMAAWGMNSVRMIVSPLGEDYFKRDPIGYMDDFLDRQVALAAEHGMYAIIDNHEFQIDWARDRMITFATLVSQRYADYDHVIYELFNEPHDGDYEDLIKLYEEALPIIRANDPDSLIIVSGMEWAGDLSYFAANPLDFSNIAYAIHPYPGKQFCNYNVECMRSTWDRKFGEMSEQYPVIATEVGWTPDGSGREWDSSTEGFGVHLIDYFNEKGVGYSILGFTNGYCCNLLETLEPDYTPSEMGILIKEDLATS